MVFVGFECFSNKSIFLSGKELLFNLNFFVRMFSVKQLCVLDGAFHIVGRADAFPFW